MTKLFTIEGIDGSGKQTVSKLVTEKLNEILKVGPDNIVPKPAMNISFPDYNTYSGHVVKDYLSGKYKLSKEDMANPYFASLFYSINRSEYFKSKMTDTQYKKIVPGSVAYIFRLDISEYNIDFICKNRSITDKLDRSQIKQLLCSEDYRESMVQFIDQSIKEILDINKISDHQVMHNDGQYVLLKYGEIECKKYESGIEVIRSITDTMPQFLVNYSINDFIKDYDPVLISDRYYISNIIHQGARIRYDDVEEGAKQYVDFINWLVDIETKKIGNPKPIKEYILVIDPDVATGRCDTRNINKNGAKVDIHENSKHLYAAHHSVKNLANYVNAKGDKPLSPVMFIDTGDMTPEQISDIIVKDIITVLKEIIKNDEK